MLTRYVRELDDATFQDAINRGGRPVLVDFWAPWCPPCRALAPTIKEPIMNSLVKALVRSGLLRDGLDHHLVRASMVLIFVLFGYQKWFEYEAQTLIPFIPLRMAFPDDRKLCCIRADARSS